MFFDGWIRKRANRQLLKENARLGNELRETQTQLSEERSKVRILGLEQENLLDVIERDRQRVLAETKGFAAEVANSDRRDKA